MCGQKSFRFHLVVAALATIVGFPVWGQGLPIRFDLDDSGISSNIFTNPSQPFPLDCLLTGDCGEKNMDQMFPGMKYFASQEEKNPDRFHLRFSNLSVSKTYLLNIPMEIKVSELAKYIFRVQHVKVEDSEIGILQKNYEVFKRDTKTFLINWEKEKDVEALKKILEKAATMEQIKRVLGAVPDQSAILTWVNGLTVAELGREIESFERDDRFVRFLRSELGELCADCWKKYNDSLLNYPNIWSNLVVIRENQTDLVGCYQFKRPTAFSIAESEFGIREDFAPEDWDGAESKTFDFLGAFFKECSPTKVESQQDEKNQKDEKKRKDEKNRHVCAFGPRFCDLVKAWFERYDFPVGQNMEIEYSKLNKFQKSLLQSFIGLEIFMLDLKNQQGLLEFFSYFYLGEEKASITGGTGTTNLDQALENLVKKACAVKKKVLAGNFVFLMSPGEYFRVLQPQLLFFHTISIPREELLTIKVEVFNESDIITHSKGYLIWKGGRTLKSGKDWGLAGSFSYQHEPYLKDSPFFKPMRFATSDEVPQDFNPDDRLLVGELNPYLSDQSEFYSGTGKLTLNGNWGSIANAKVILQYQARKFGAEDRSDKVTAGLYRLAVFEKNGSSLAFGKFGFDNSADGLGIKLEGDGLHLKNNRFDLGYLIRQESEAGTPNAANRDHKVYWGKIPNLGLPRWGIFHTISLHALYGQNEKDIYKVKLTDEKDLKGRLFTYEPESDSDLDSATPLYYQIEEDAHPYNYWTAGLQGRFSVTHSKRWSSSGYLAYFQSERRASSTDTQAKLQLPANMEDGNDETKSIEIPRDPFVKGEGRSWLLSWTLQENRSIPHAQKNSQVSPGRRPENKVRQKFQFLVGHGSGGYRKSILKDRGYLGETSSFAPDLIFLSGLAPVLTSIEPTIGEGLANKSYASVRYQRDSSIIKALMKKLGWGEAVVKGNSTLAFHYYRLNNIDQPRNNFLLKGATEDAAPTTFALKSKDLGWEFNFMTEAALPNKIKPQLMFAYYAPGSALDDLVKKDLWFAGFSLNLEF